MEQNMEPKVEVKPKKKKVLLIVGIVAGFIVVAAAAFLGGRLLNGNGSSISLLPFGNDGGMVTSMSVSFEPAPELPTTEPEVVGTFTERQDNTIFVQEFSMEAGGGGVVISVVGGDSSGGGDAMGGPVISTSGETGPKVEVVVTNDTLVYVDVTPMDFQPGENTTIQQVVEIGSIDDLTSETMVTVWGRKVGDRIIADVISYSKPVMFTSP